MRNNLVTLLAQESIKRQEKITVNKLAEELKPRGVSRNSLYAFSQNKLKEYPESLLLALMNYFDCDLDELFIIEHTDEQLPQVSKEGDE